MKIRAIELTNLRRFAGHRARIEGIGDGISVLAQPNEYGKSTFFDAIHALFFAPHRSQTAQVKLLQPHAGGAPEAAVEIELPEGDFRVEKRWLSRPGARVLDNAGRLVAQEDEAEAWIGGLMGDGLAGPSGLLWVRQGLAGLEPGGTSTAERNERAQGLSARRDLLSSVAGEIELMTGGRRMDQVTARVKEEIDRLATPKLHPKKSGEWGRALEEANTLEAARAELETKAAHLSSHLAERTRMTRELARLSDPEETARDLAAQAEAEAALEAAEAHVEQVQRAQAALNLARLRATQGKESIATLTALRERLDAASATQERTARELTEAEVRVQESAAQEAAAAAHHESALGASAAAAEALTQAQRAHLAHAARERATTLAAEIARAERQRTQIEAHRADRAALKITPELLEAAEKAQARCDRLAAQDEARLVALRLSYTGAARVLHEGHPLPPEGMRLRGTTRLDLPGIGEMFIEPGATGGGDIADQITRAAGARDRALTACGADDLASARAALSRAQQLDTAISQAEALLAELAPDGLAALRAQHAAASAEASEVAEAPEADMRALQTALREAREAEAQALATRREAETRHAALREARAGRQAAAQAATQTLGAARAEAGDPVELAAKLLNMAEAQTALDTALAEADKALQSLLATAPDIDTARAAATRLRAVVEGRDRERVRLEAALAGVNGSIGALADEGIEETLDEIRGREEEARARAARYEREVRALARLQTALEDARRAAHEVYFEPVLRELDPLLSILHPGASLRIDDESLLPATLVRNGQDEALDILSGGTSEQLAVLTRLAFARLFARSGRPVPVILDDALVHSDDDRIEAMFTALHRVAEGQQIIVFTCRQRAFASLGGERLEARIEAV